MLGKTFKGMTDEMLRWQTERFLELAVDGTAGWVVDVRPEQVVEIAFDGRAAVDALPRRRGAALRAGAALPRRQDRRRGRHHRHGAGAGPRNLTGRFDTARVTLTARGPRRKARQRPPATPHVVLRTERTAPMTIEIPKFLTSAQADLVRETEPQRMDALDEDALLELHTRVRRARSKYVKLYRQTGASRVGMKGARGHARPGNASNAAKAEVFELALARVSARVDVVARAAAEELKAERLAAVAASRGSTGPGSPQAGAGSKAAGASTRRRATKTTGWPQARRVDPRQGQGAPGEEGLALTVRPGGSAAPPARG